MKQSDDLKPVFNNAVSDAPAAAPDLTPEPVSLKKIQGLLDQLSEPRLVLESTPMGTTSRVTRTENDQKILAEIADMRRRLEERRNKARDEFNMAHDGPMGRSLRW